jgi:DNA adenine methylase
MNFLRTVKYHPCEFVRVLRLLPNSRQLFAETLDADQPVTSMFRAARFLYLSQASFGGLRKHWASEGRNNGGGLRNHSSRPFLKARIYRWALRLARATIESAPWEECVEKYDSAGALFYFDPPYLGLRS